MDVPGQSTHGQSGPRLDLRFGEFAGRYDSARPDYPRIAVSWILEGIDGLVVELGAGTGKFTAALADRGLRVLATEPDAAMLEVLRARVPGALPARAAAEAIPALRADAVIAAQAWHWFDRELAWESAQRVVGTTGRIAAVWNAPSRRPSWQREINALGPVLSPVNESWWPPGIPRNGVETALFYWTESLSPAQVRDECLTHLAVYKLPPDQRADYLHQVESIATRAATSRKPQNGRVDYERLTWCVRTTTPERTA